MHFVVFTPPLVLAADCVNSFHLARHLFVAHRFDADDVGRIERVDGIHVLADATERDELVGDSGGG